MSSNRQYQVVLDLAALQGEHAPERGIARYVLETTRALQRRGAPIAQLGLSPLRGVPDHIPSDLLDSGLAEWLTQASLERRRLGGPTVLHVFSPFELVAPVDALYLPASTAPGSATTATVYDAIPHTARDEYLALRLARSRYDIAARFLASCTKVFGISRHACDQAVEHLGVEEPRIALVGAGAGHFFQPEARTGEQRTLIAERVPEVGERFVLAVGGWEPRKNIESLIEAMGLLPRAVRAEHRLVQVGAVPSEVAERWRQRAAEVGLAPEQLVMLGRVDDVVLRALYQTCRLFVFPSLDEGFGLPVLEAARCGAVVITSDRASVPEVLDDPSSTFPAQSPSAMADRIARALCDDSDRAHLLAVGAAAAARHTWDAVADGMIAAWDALKWPMAAREPRRHIAVVGTFDREASSEGAVARQNLALAEAFTAHATVTCFDVREDHSIEARSIVPVRPARALGELTAVTAYDHVIHLVGPQPLPAALRLLREAPGVVLVESSGIARGYRSWHPGVEVQTWLTEELLGPERRRAHPAIREGGLEATAGLPEGRPFGSRPLLQGQELVVVNSQRDASLLRLDLGPRPASVQVEVVEPVAPSSSEVRSRLGTRPVIVIVGDAAPWSWAVQHLMTTLECAVEYLDLDGPDPMEGDRQWRALLRGASVLVFLDHDARCSHAAWAAEAVSHGIPVVTTGSWSSAFPPGVIRFVEPSASNVTMYSHIAALAQPSPLSREQERASGHLRDTSSAAQRAEGIMALLDGRRPPPRPTLAPRPVPPMATTSAICRAADFADPSFAEWCRALAEPPGPRRKLWEHVAIARAFELAEVLRPGARGLGFGVGTEPLTAAFAARGARVTATDLDSARSEARAWSRTGEHAARFADLNAKGICPSEDFDRLVEFGFVDMTDIPLEFNGQYDFCWSSCAFEHLGSIEAGLHFVERSVDTLRPGGIAVHTTELVLSSDVLTLEKGMTVLFRESDLRELVERLETNGHLVAPLDTALGDEFLDLHVDVPPYQNEPHLKLELGGHLTTSIVLIVQRSDD